MVDFELGEFTGRRRFDRVTAGTLVLTVDAALFVVIAVVGVPFLLLVFGDDDTGTWPRMAPLLAWWTAAALLGAACTVAVVRSLGRNGAGGRRLGVVAAIATVVAVATLVAVSFDRAPLLAVLGTLLALANVAAARVLRPAAAEPFEELPEFVVEDRADDDAEADAEPFDDEPGDARVTVELTRTGPGRAVSSAARRRLRGRAALQAHAGVRLTRRPRRSPAI
jgi:hypothetical protein